MARIWSTGFELQSMTAGASPIEIGTTAGSAAPAISTAVKRSGAASVYMDANANVSYFTKQYAPTGTPITDLYIRFYLRVAARPSTIARIIQLTNASATVASIYLNTDGTLEFWDGYNVGQIGSDSSALSNDTWYCIEMKVCENGGGNKMEARIDGTSFASTTSGPTNTGGSYLVYIGFLDTCTGDVYYDDIAINDTTGSFQNSWPNDGEIIHLRPSAAGDNTEWDSGTYASIDEITPNDATDYIATNDTTNDLFDANIDATPAGLEYTDSIACVSVGVRVTLSSATSDDPTFVLRIKAAASGTVEESSAITYDSTLWNTHALAEPRLYNLNLYDLPGSSTVVWTKADLDTAQIGARFTAADAGNSSVRISTLWLLVDHTANTPKIETLTDNFDDNSINSYIWSDDGATETGGEMSILAATGQGTYNGIASDSRYDLTDSYALIELVNAGDTSLSFTTYILELYNDTVDLYWGIEYGATDEIVAYKSPDSAAYTEIYRATYDSNVHKWFRIREASGTVYWDTSADGENWTNRDSDATGYTLTALNAFFGVENPGSGSTSVIFDNFNAPPTTTSSDRDTIITGKDTSNASRAAKLTGLVESIYTKEVKTSLPSDDASLALAYTSQEVTDVATDDATRVPLTATSTDFMVHHYKYYYSTESADQFTVTWNGQSTLAPSSATVYLQVYNHNTPGWETIDSDNATAANTDFDLSATVSTNLAYYYDAYYIVTCRVYQEIT